MTPGPAGAVDGRRDPEPAQARRARRDPRRPRAAAAARRRRAAARGRARRSPGTRSARRAPRVGRPARRRSPTTPGSRRRRSAAARACARPATPARRRPTSENLALLLARGRAATTIARSPTSARWPTSIPAARRSSARRGARDAWPTSRAASGGFGYDPAFVPDDIRPTAAHDGRADAGREARDLPPRPRPRGRSAGGDAERVADDRPEQGRARRCSRSSPTAC